MRQVISLLCVLSIFLLLAPKAQAIVFVPALILIPIAKIVAIIIGGFTFPALGVGVLWSKLSGTSLKYILVGIFFSLLILSILLVVFLKLHTPGRPLF